MAKYIMVPKFASNIYRQSIDDRAYLREDIYNELIASLPKVPTIIYDCGGIYGRLIDGHPGGHKNSFDIWYFEGFYTYIYSIMCELLIKSKNYRFRTNSIAYNKLLILSKAAKAYIEIANLFIYGYQGNAVLTADDGYNHGHHWHGEKIK
jgi:hypothetical protein